MKQDARSIVRKRTQQLVYLELGRNNGGVMLNLSEEGCGFQAISPVERGTTRFAFQISGGQRIAGEGEVAWTDGVGITGGMRFLDLSEEARKQIRTWLIDTNAPEELGEGIEPATVSVANGNSRANGAARSAESTPPPPREPRQYSSFGGTRMMVEETPSPAPGWMHVPIDNLPSLEDERERFPLLRGDGGQSRSAAFWRGVAGLMAAGAIAALLATHQSEVGSSLIWLGETLSGKTKTSAVAPAPADKPAATTASATTDPNANAAAAKASPDAAAKADAGLEPKEGLKTPEQAGPEERPPAKTDAAMKSADRGVSMLEQQPANPTVDTHYEGETVQSLWEAVQAGSVSAEVSLADRFARGVGVMRNCEQAKVLLRAAANKGNKDARLKLYVLESGGCR
jgi:PilZ domain